MKVAVVTDSNSGFTQQAAEEAGIYLLPMPVIIEEETCYEGKDLTQERFYSSLTGNMHVTTSQPSPGDVADLWDQLLEQGYDQIVHIPMSSGLSNSCATAISLAKEYKGRVFVADNHRISVTLKEAALDARAMADAGYTGEQIQKLLEEEAYNASIYIAVDTLEFLKKGGRITAAGAALGTVLHIKPILSIQGEKLDAFAKVRGMKKCRATMIKALKDDLNSRFASYAPGRIQILTAGAGLTGEEAAEWRKMVEEAFPGMDVYYDPLSFSIACHTGPGAMGIGCIIRNELRVRGE